MNSCNTWLVLIFGTLCSFNAFATGNGSIGSFSEQDNECLNEICKLYSNQIVNQAVDIAKKLTVMNDIAMKSAIDTSDGVTASETAGAFAATVNFRIGFKSLQQNEIVTLDKTTRELKSSALISLILKKSTQK